MELQEKIGIFLTVAFAVANVCAQNDPIVIADTKAIIGRALFSKEEPAQISLKWEELKTGINEHTPKFRTLDHHFMYDNPLKPNFHKPARAYSMETNGSYVAQKYDWNGEVFLATCYENKVCNVYKSEMDSYLEKKQSISVKDLPMNVYFFHQRDNLYLVLVANVSTVYRWADTYFDAEDNLYTPHANDVATFNYKDATIMAFAQGVDESYASKVFVKRGKGFELRQQLDVKLATKVLHYDVHSEQNGLQNYLIFVSENSGSQIFWWNLKDLSRWATLRFAHTHRQMLTSRIGDLPFLFILSKQNIDIYQATLNGVNLKLSVETDEEITDLALDGSLVLLLSRMGPTTIAEVHVRNVSNEDNRMENLKKCMANLKSFAKEQKNLVHMAAQKLQFMKNQAVDGVILQAEVDGKLTLNNANIQQLIVQPEGPLLKESPTQLVSKLKQLKEKVNDLKEKLSKISTKRRSLHVKGDLDVETLVINQATIGKVNGEDLNMDDFLSVSKDQNLGDTLKAKSLSVDHLKTSRLNNHSPEDLLLKNKEKQKVSGEVTIEGLRARNIRFGSNAKVNGVNFNKYATMETRNIKGIKTVPGFVAKQLYINTINQEPFEDWIEKMKPDLSNNNEKSLFYQNLTVGQLQVEAINNIPWTDIQEKIKNEKNMSGQRRVRNLVTSRINNIPVKFFLTKTTDQNVTSDIDINTVFADSMQTKTLNNISMAEFSDLVVPLVYTQDPNQSERKPVFTNSSDFLRKVNKYNIKRFLQCGCENTNATIIVNGPIIVRNLFNADYINNVHIPSTLPEIVLTTDKSHLNSFVFRNLSAGLIKTKKLNSVPIIPSLQVNGNTLLSSVFWDHNIEKNEVRIKGEQHCDQVLIPGNLNATILGSNFEELLENRLSRTKNQRIKGLVTSNKVNVTNLHANFINTVAASSLIDIGNATLTIYSSLEFSNVSVKGEISGMLTESCDLLQKWSIDLQNISKFDSLEVVKNISWSEASSEDYSLSHILKNAVRFDTENVIKAPMKFQREVFVDLLETSDPPFDVNLTFIQGDAIFKNRRSQKIRTGLYLKPKTTVGKATMRRNVKVDTIDGVEINDFNNKLYRIDDDYEIDGLKTFQKGFYSNSIVTGMIHNVLLDKLVSVQEITSPNKERVFPHYVFKDLSVLTNATLSYVNDFDLQLLLNQRASLTSNQTIKSKLLVTGNVYADGYFDAHTINNIPLNETQSTTDNVVINGTLEIGNGMLTVKGDVQAEIVNNKNLPKLYETSIKTNENATINGSIVFKTELIVKGDIEINEVNGCNIEETFKSAKEYEPKLLFGKNNTDLHEKIDSISTVLRNYGGTKLFKYLEYNTSMNFDLVNVKETSVIERDDLSKDVHIYGMTDASCGLPANCLCPLQYTLKINASGAHHVVLNEQNLRRFEYNNRNLQMSITVETTTISFSNRCRSTIKKNEYTILKWQKKQSSEEGETNSLEGYLSDVKFFKLGSSIYTVLAFYYNGNLSEPRDLNVLVYELRTDMKEIVQIDSIPVKGAVAVDVVWAGPSYLLVIGNTKSEDPASDTVYTEVYRFNERTNKFSILKKIGTHGVMDLKAVRIKKGSFIFIVQKKPWPLLTFKYFPEYDTVLFMEKFHSRHGFLNVAPIAGTEGDSDEVYIGVVSMNNKFIIMKYKHIEGFTEILSVTQDNVQALETFSISSERYILAISSGSTPSQLLRVIN